MPVRVVEFRNYRLRPGVREAFIGYFEERFLDSQEDAGMRVLGQFRLVGEPDRFVWIRGFEDMASRRQALERFYGGPYWERWKGPANDMMVEWDRVHLLRPSGGSWPLADRIRHSPSGGPDERAKVVATFCRASRDGHHEGFEERIGSALEDRGHALLGGFVSETAENDFPLLPVIQAPGLLLILSLHQDRTEDRAWRPARVEHPEISEVLELEPTDRSALGRPALGAT
ncbi:MAG: NIPSNAP family protein [Gemmatimonadota bacterium]